MIYAGRGDVERSMALLWRAVLDEGGGAEGAAAGSKRGPKQGLSVDAIVSAAIEVADSEGLASLSMKAVGERLGRTGMSLYTYVPSKRDLIDLMYDQAHAEHPAVRDSAAYDAGDDWRAGVRGWVDGLWELYSRHPWLLLVSPARPVLGPNEFAALEAVAVVLRRTGLTARKLRPIVGTLSHFVRGAARTVAESREAASQTGVSDDEWWGDRFARLSDVVPDLADRFPAALWIDSGTDTGTDTGTDGGEENYLEAKAADAYRIGLDVIVAGIAATIAEHGDGPLRERGGPSRSPDG